MSHETPAGPIGRLLAAWNRFWFSPADPTTLGVMRILAGLLTLYVHLAYSFDLQEFMGRNAWLGLDYANKQRWERPFTAPPAGWSMAEEISVATPADPEVRRAFVEFLRHVADNPSQHSQVLAFLAPPPDAKGVFQVPDPPRDLHIPSYVLNLRPDLQNHPLSRRAVAQYLNSLLPLSKEVRDANLDYLNEWRIDPRDVDNRGGSRGHYYWSVWFHITDPGWMTFTHLVIVLIIGLFTIGFCTRITAVLTWLLAMCYMHRSPITVFGCDVMMNILLFYLMIGPSGAALSVDRLIRRWWQKRQARLQGQPEPEWSDPQPMASANLALRLLQIHLCIIYLSSGTSKLTGGTWWNGTAIYYTVANYEFSLLRFAFFDSALRFICQQRWLWETMMAAGSYFTLVLEIGFPFLIWNRRLRPFLVVGALMLHAGIAIFMGLFAFQMFMGTMVLCFIPGTVCRRAFNWLKGDRQLQHEEEPEEETADEKPGKATSIQFMR